jgi:hypothetical protein
MTNNTELLIRNACAYPAACILAMLLAGVADAQDWKMQPLQISTRWAASVNPANALSEYPRPQLVRRHWQSLNGLWRYAITTRDAGIPTRYQGSILVPYPLESALSGVQKPLRPDQLLWYRRTVVLKPGQTYRNTIVFRFTTDRQGRDRT